MAKEISQLAIDGVHVWEHPRLPLTNAQGIDIEIAAHQLYNRVDISADEIAAFEQEFLTEF